jgi:gamma-glutamylcyclotransferase (GGCT)/AIG2-like uncharacterized protein YtfP
VSVPPTVTLVRGSPSEVTSLLAVYGTLRRGYRNWPLIASASTVVLEGTLPGRLLHISSPMRRYPYPGYIPCDPTAATAPRRVIVEVVSIDDAALWPQLDALERYDPADIAGSEYVRVEAVATGAGGQALRCWTYRYQGSVEGHHVVPDGDWARLYRPGVDGH